MSAQLSIVEAGPECDREMAQWFTKPKLAADLVGLASDLFADPRWGRHVLRVLEPSAGRGNLVRAVIGAAPAGTQTSASATSPSTAARRARTSPSSSTSASGSRRCCPSARCTATRGIARSGGASTRANPEVAVMTCTRCKDPRRFAWSSTFGVRTETLCSHCRGEWNAFVSQALSPARVGEAARGRARGTQ